MFLRFLRRGSGPRGGRLLDPERLEPRSRGRTGPLHRLHDCCRHRAKGSTLRMCGRSVLANISGLVARFGLLSSAEPDAAPRYNVAPSRSVFT